MLYVNASKREKKIKRRDPLYDEDFTLIGFTERTFIPVKNGYCVILYFLSSLF